MRRAIPASLALLLVAAVACWGCGGGKEPRAWLDETSQSASRYIEDGGYLHFGEEVEYRLTTGESSVEQSIEMEGDNIFPYRQRYDYRETVISAEMPDQPQENSFSYLTVDGGATAFVEGERLTEQLGVIGWIHYTPTEEENRFFNYPDLIKTLTSTEDEVRSLGYKEVDGTRCVHLQYKVSGEDLMRMRLQEDPSLQEKYQDVDISELFDDMEVELWIGEDDGLPRQVVMSQVILEEEQANAEIRFHILLSGYGEEAPVQIEQPAFFTDAM
ncbi:MAG: hypothetical protein SWK76_04945 [Actinomycetota bacterium]|nr:hypothetical protein [Actinomycetota bacterium]